jgi:hypothetical protein
MFSDHERPEEVEIKERHSLSSVLESSRKKLIPRNSLDSEQYKSNSFQYERKSLDSFNLPQRNTKEPTSRIMNIIKGKRKIIHVRNHSLKSPRSISVESLPNSEDKMDDDELPPLEEQEELSQIGLRRKENSFIRISKDYRERFRLDPRFYFFLHLFWILSVGFFGGSLIYYVEMANTQTTFIDSIFTSFSAVTVTGLFVINFPTFTLFSKVVIFFCICKY